MMTPKQIIWIGAGIGLLIVTGVVHGLWTDRWRQVPELGDAAANLVKLPEHIGSWQGKDLDLDASELTNAGYAGALWRCYGRPQGGGSVSMLLICGRPGRVSVHTPEACYRGEGYELAAAPIRVDLPAVSSGTPAEFWKGRFVKTSSSAPRQLCIYWSWNAGQGWEAPASPRLRFSRFPLLYKLYLVSEIDPANESVDPCAELLPLLLAELQETVLTEAGSPEQPR